MKLTMVASPPTERRLKALRQLGADYAVHYDMEDMPDELAEVRKIRDYYARFDLPLKVAEAGPAIDRIVMGKDGAAEQIERYKRIIGYLGKSGVEIIAYNFMPQISADAMVVRTALDAVTRGGARTSSFRFTEVTAATMPHSEMPIPRERMWENLERFLRAVVPVAEEAGVRLAMHPDDPPMSPLCGLERIMSSTEDFDRLLAISPSPSNAITFCIGCFAEMGADIPALLARYRDRTPYVHVRDIRGTPNDFIETFPDDGQTNLVAIFQKLHEIGFGGYVRSDHAPQIATDDDAGPEGYALHGHLFALGYLRGLDHATAMGRTAESAALEEAGDVH